MVDTAFPDISTWIAGLFVGIPAGIWDIGTFADLSNIGTLFAFIVVAAGVIVLRRKTLETLDSFGDRGPAPGQFQGAHHLASDSKGNLYVTEVAPGARIQRFLLIGYK